MQPEMMRSQWDRYVHAWADISDEERQLLLRDSVAADCVYTNALAQCHGHAEPDCPHTGFPARAAGGQV